jgi:hypothetical protein
MNVSVWNRVSSVFFFYWNNMDNYDAGTHAGFHGNKLEPVLLSMLSHCEAPVANPGIGCRSVGFEIIHRSGCIANRP